MTIPFWVNDPSILLKKEYLFDIWPSTDMSYEQKLNAVTRLIIIMSILGFITTNSIRILIIGFTNHDLLNLLESGKIFKIAISTILSLTMSTPVVSRSKKHMGRVKFNFFIY